MQVEAGRVPMQQHRVPSGQGISEQIWGESVWGESVLLKCRVFVSLVLESCSAPCNRPANRVARGCSREGDRCPAWGKHCLVQTAWASVPEDASSPWASGWESQWPKAGPRSFAASSLVASSPLSPLHLPLLLPTRPSPSPASPHSLPCSGLLFPSRLG